VARCETVLNTTMAEMETYHTQKVEDFSTLTKEHLDGEIAFYEQVLSLVDPDLVNSFCYYVGFGPPSNRSSYIRITNIRHTRV
jgi:hypothetical protein